RLPDLAVLRNRHIQLTPSARGMIVNDQGAAILQGQRVDAAIGIWQGCGGHWTPGLARIGGPTLGDFHLLAPTKKLHPALRIGQDSGLNRGEFLSIIERLGALPCCTEVESDLEMNTPAVVFGARWTYDCTVMQFDWFVFDRTQNAFRKPPRFGPGLAVVVRSLQHAPP